MTLKKAVGIVLLAAAISLLLLTVTKPVRAATTTGCAGGVSWQVAAHSIGKTVRLDGAVLGAKYVQWKSGKGSMTFLDFGGKYPNAKFTAIIWNKDATSLIGHRVCLRGKVTLYHGQPEMSVG